MRTREDVEEQLSMLKHRMTVTPSIQMDFINLEVLLDIRELLQKKEERYIPDGRTEIDITPNYRGGIKIQGTGKMPTVVTDNVFKTSQN